MGRGKKNGGGGDEAGDGKKCGDCGMTKGKEAFTGAQWKKAERQCKACAAAEEDLLLAGTQELQSKKKRKQERLQKEAEAKEAKRAADPTTKEGWAKRKEACIEAVLLTARDPASPSFPTYEELLQHAKYVDENVGAGTVQADGDAVTKARTLAKVLVAHCAEIVAARTTIEKGLSVGYVQGLGSDELFLLARDLDFDTDELATLQDADIRDKIVARATEKASKLLCETCSKWLPKGKFSKAQRKKTEGGAQCQHCWRREEEERIFMEEYQRMYGCPFEDEEDVYTAQANLYETMGVEIDISADDLKKTYRKLAVKYHPDRWAAKPADAQKEAEEKFKLVTEAYETLSDIDKRRAYDREFERNEKKRQRKEAARAAAERKRQEREAEEDD